MTLQLQQQNKLSHKSTEKPPPKKKKNVLHALNTTVNFCCPQVEEYVMEIFYFKMLVIAEMSGIIGTFESRLCQYNSELFKKPCLTKNNKGNKSHVEGLFQRQGSEYYLEQHH